jgi:hypothetical protein
MRTAGHPPGTLVLAEGVNIGRLAPSTGVEPGRSNKMAQIVLTLVCVLVFLAGVDPGGR